jgi:hypothetical protein
VRATVLPLFGNVPPAPEVNSGWLGEELVSRGIPERRALSREATVRLGIFGAIHPGWSLAPLMRHLESPMSGGREVVVASIGRIGAGKPCWDEAESSYGGRVSFALLGERTHTEISTFLQSVDFGLSMAPWRLIGKSGTVAAMLEHGLPVIVTRDDAHYGVEIPALEEPLLHLVDADLPNWLRSVHPQRPQSRLPAVARQFLLDLQCASAKTSNRPRQQSSMSG